MVPFLQFAQINVTTTRVGCRCSASIDLQRVLFVLRPILLADSVQSTFKDGRSTYTVHLAQQHVVALREVYTCS